MPNPLSVMPIHAAVQSASFDLYATIIDSLRENDVVLQDGDVLAVSSKFVAISEGRIVELDQVVVSERALELAERFKLLPQLAQLVLNESDHIFGGIQMGFMLTWKNGVISPNAGIDRSNIPNGKAVLLPARPYEAAAAIRAEMYQRLGVDIGVILTDSWLVPGRIGTTGVAVGTAGFMPVQDERGKADLFGNPMLVTQVGIADSISVCAQMVMGERDEAIPMAVVRNSGVELTDAKVSVDHVAIPWQMCIYVESLTLGLLEDGAPRESMTINMQKRDMAGF